MLDGTERLGVLGVTLPAEVLDDDAAMRGLKRLAGVIADLVVTKTAYGDSIVKLRRTSQMALAAEVQWSLLPPLTFVNSTVTIAGGLEPAYEVAGDSLDYAVDAGIARFAIFDGMGHGIVSAQLISLVVAAYRNARRCERSLSDTAAHIESAVNDVFRVESFATGLLCELDSTRGILTWISAGHLEPLLLREGRLVRALHVDPLLPLGLNQPLSTPAQLRSAPSTCSQETCCCSTPTASSRLARRTVSSSARTGWSTWCRATWPLGSPPPRPCAGSCTLCLDHQAGDLDDDATLLLVEWHGPPAPGDDSPRLSVTGERALDPS